MIQILEWVFIKTIYGPAALAAAVSGLVYLLRRISPRVPHHFAIGGIVFVLLISTLPSYPRYQFHKSISNSLEQNGAYVRVINVTHWGSLTEPLTWFYSFVGSAHTVGPSDPLMPGTFRRVVVRFEEEPRISLEEPSCEDQTISIAEPDQERVFRYTEWNRKMEDGEKSLYCETDWTNELRAVREAFLSRSREQN